MNYVFTCYIRVSYMDSRDRSDHYEVRCAMKAQALAIDCLSPARAPRLAEVFDIRLAFEHTVVMG